MSRLIFKASYQLSSSRQVLEKSLTALQELNMYNKSVNRNTQEDVRDIYEHAFL